MVVPIHPLFILSHIRLPYSLLDEAEKVSTIVFDKSHIAILCIHVCKSKKKKHILYLNEFVYDFLCLLMYIY